MANNNSSSQSSEEEKKKKEERKAKRDQAIKDANTIWDLIKLFLPQ